MKELTLERLRKHFLYNPDTGLFLWKESGTGRPISRIAGGVNGHGYIQIRFNGKSYRAHRLAFLYMTGEYPPKDVDHINGDKTDNRFKNLRHATRSQNLRNQKIRKNNKSGCTGISQRKSTGKWRATIMACGRWIHVGEFIKKTDAIKARKQAEIEYGYHENHGRPA